MATDELTADILTADQIKYMLAGESCFPPEVRKLWDQNNLLRADRDRLREERNVALEDKQRVVAKAEKLSREIAAKDAEIQRWKNMSVSKFGQLKQQCAPMEDWRGANEDGRKR